MVGAADYGSDTEAPLLAVIEAKTEKVEATA